MIELSKRKNLIGIVPRDTDVQDGATVPHAVKAIIDPDNCAYFYIIPRKNDKLSLIGLWFLFRRNGVRVNPHHSRHYNTMVLRVKNQQQCFMCEVYEAAKKLHK